MASYAMSVEDEHNGNKQHTILNELSWDKLWEVLFIYDGDILRRKGKKFYIATSEPKERLRARI